MPSSIIEIMTPVIPSSVNNVPLIPGTLFSMRKSDCLSRSNLLKKSTKQTLSSQKCILPISTSIVLFPQFRGELPLNHRLRFCAISATGTDLVVEEADSPATDADSGEPSESSLNTAGTAEEESSVKAASQAAPVPKKRTRPVRKSEMPPIKNEELVPGASFTGKVRSIQPFGAFVDFGAFTDGLVHVSQLSDSFVKDVGNVVSVGQEVTVRLLEANMETGRISLTMREGDDINKLLQPQDAPSSSDRGRPPRKGPPKSGQRKNEAKKASKFVKGQDLEGTVKNLTKSGCFVSLPEGEEGFLPASEEVDEGFGNFMGGSSLQVGQEVSVRVLKITRGQVTLTMKKEEDARELDSKLSQGVIHAATSPFVLAFRKNKDIAAFLDEREKEAEAIPQASDELEEKVTQTEAELDEVQDPQTGSSEINEIEGKAGQSEVEVEDQKESNSSGLPTAGSAVEDDGTSSKEESVEASTVEEASNEISSENVDPEPVVSDSLPGIDGAAQSTAEEVEAVEVTLDGSTPASVLSAEEAPAADGTEKDGESSAPETIPDQISSEIPVGKEENETADNVENREIEISSSSQSPDGAAKSIEEKQEVDSGISPPEGSAAAIDQVSEEVSATSGLESDTESDISVQVASEDLSKGSTRKNEITFVAPTENENVGSSAEENGSIINSNGQVEVPDLQQSTTGEIVVDELEETLLKDVVQKMPAADGEIPAVTLVDAKQEEAVPESAGPNSHGQNGNPSQKESTVKAAISPALVKQLREETGAGMMDCKKALSETGGDLVKAQEYLRKKGLASADKKASRATAEGRIGSYIHDGRIGILIEVNCETDFVSRGDMFKELVDDLAMQAAACPQVRYLVPEDVPQEIVDKEREIEMQKEDLLSKPEQIRSKIVEGRIKKRLDELALLEQPYIKNDKLVVKDLVKQTIATIGENIKVTRFVRYNLGEGLEKKSEDFAAEVAAQTAAKAVTLPKQEPVATEVKETVGKLPKVAVSAALVKKLREETGAGMMDCKKALSETGGDLEKAQEYLRKKGLSTADKKSSRLAAEGRIGSYIHDSRIGVLIEVNCETDFVGRSANFKELVDDLAMQVVACPQVQYVSVEDIPESIIKKERELEMQREDLQSKPENIREKVVEGRISKRFGELALLEQPFIKDDSILVKDLVKQTVAALGENIKVRRFVRFTLGETAASAKTETEA